MEPHRPPSGVRPAHPNGEREPITMRRMWLIAATSPWLPFILFLVVFGATAVLGGDKPAEVERTYSAWLVWVWAGSYVVGGTLAILGCILDRPRLEQASLAALCLGLGLYIGAEADDFFVATLFLAAFGARLFELHKARELQQRLEGIRLGGRSSA